MPRTATRVLAQIGLAIDHIASLEGGVRPLLVDGRRAGVGRQDVDRPRVERAVLVHLVQAAGELVVAEHGLGDDLVVLLVQLDPLATPDRAMPRVGSRPPLPGFTHPVLVVLGEADALRLDDGAVAVDARGVDPGDDGALARPEPIRRLGRIGAVTVPALLIFGSPGYQDLQLFLKCLHSFVQPIDLRLEQLDRDLHEFAGGLLRGEFFDRVEVAHLCGHPPLSAKCSASWLSGPGASRSPRRARRRSGSSSASLRRHRWSWRRNGQGRLTNRVKSTQPSSLTNALYPALGLSPLGVDAVPGVIQIRLQDPLDWLAHRITCSSLTLIRNLGSPGLASLISSTSSGIRRTRRLEQSVCARSGCRPGRRDSRTDGLPACRSRS